jgi:Domain of unknown function (DUF2610)
MKKFSINCDFGGQMAPFDFYIGQPEKEHHPLHFQADWLAKQRNGVVPAEVMTAIAKLKDIAEKNNVSLEDLCVYAIGSWDKEDEGGESQTEDGNSATSDQGTEDSDLAPAESDLHLEEATENEDTESETIMPQTTEVEAAEGETALTETKPPKPKAKKKPAANSKKMQAEE